MLKQRLHPVQREALLSAKLTKRRQQSSETVDKYAQDFENLFGKSYGKRAVMDNASREMLKRDLFVQGLALKWQEKVVPSVETFSDALHQARLAEDQHKQLGDLSRNQTAEWAQTQK